MDVDEEIFSLGATAHADVGNVGPRREDIIGGGAGSLNGLLSMGSGRDTVAGRLETSSGLGMGGLGTGGDGMGNLGSLHHWYRYLEREGDAEWTFFFLVIFIHTYTFVGALYHMICIYRLVYGWLH